MISGIGVDIEEVKRFKGFYRNAKFTSLLFSKSEVSYCMKKKEPYIHFAGKFCAKEAASKAYHMPIKMKDIEIANSASGKVFIRIKGKRQDKAHCSISHTGRHAIAFVVVEK